MEVEYRKLGERRTQMEEIHYRHEWKHELNYLDLLTIRQRLRAVMEPDPHAVDGKYLIRSLYFDNPEDKALREKIDGVNLREKFRIRYYNGDLSLIHLEKKSRRNGLGTKYSASLRQEEAQAQELYCKMRFQRLQPKTIVDYTREPFIYRPGNVRVTFDYDIRTGMNCTDFLNPNCITVPAGDAPILLEVKWGEFLPEIIRASVQTPGRRVTAFSKYAQCRIYG